MSHLSRSLLVICLLILTGADLAQAEVYNLTGKKVTYVAPPGFSPTDLSEEDFDVDFVDFSLQTFENESGSYEISLIVAKNPEVKPILVRTRLIRLQKRSNLSSKLLRTMDLNINDVIWYAVEINTKPPTSLKSKDKPVEVDEAGEEKKFSDYVFHANAAVDDGSISLIFAVEGDFGEYPDIKDDLLNSFYNIKVE